MLSVAVKIEDLGASAALRDLLGVMANRQALHENMGEAVKAGVVEHLLGLNSRSPNTSFYGRAARSAEADPLRADDAGATVSITHRGFALRFHGGRVLPKNVNNLALPTKHVPLSSGENEGRKGPREMGLLAFLAGRKGVAGTTGYLVEGMENGTITRGKRKGQPRIVPKPGGRLMYVLRKWTDHKEDPSVLPAVVELHRLAREGAAAFVKLYS